MNTTDLLSSWSTLSLDEIEARVESGADAQALEQLLGADEAAELQRLTHGPVARGLRPAVVLMPGIMGSLLVSVRGVNTVLWINPLLFLKGQGSYLQLSADGSRDAHAEIDAVPLSLEKLCYTKIALALRRQVDLYEFPYDWRRPVQVNGDLLATYLERWAAGDAARPFTLVGHSMGGLVARACLARHPELAGGRVAQVIMLGTPHFGAANAVETLLNGNSMMALVTKLNDKNQVADLLKNLPSAYQLLPAPPDLFPAHRPYPANWDLYDAGAWHLAGIRQDYLDAGLRFHHELAASDPQAPLVEIAGCEVETGVEVERSFGANDEPRLAVTKVGTGPDAGDGTVPLWSAMLPGAAVYYVQEVHRYLPRNKQVIQATLSLIHGGDPDLPATLPAAHDMLVARSPGLPDVEAADLRRRLEQGTAREEDLAQLYFAF